MQYFSIEPIVSRSSLTLNNNHLSIHGRFDDVNASLSMLSEECHRNKSDANSTKAEDHILNSAYVDVHGKRCRSGTVTGESPRPLYALGTLHQPSLNENLSLELDTLTAGSSQRSSDAFSSPVTDAVNYPTTTLRRDIVSDMSLHNSYSPQLALIDNDSIWDPKLSVISSSVSVCSASSSDSFSTSVGNSSSVSTVHSSCAPTRMTLPKHLPLIEDRISVTDSEDDNDTFCTPESTTLQGLKESDKRRGPGAIAERLFGKLKSFKKVGAISRSASFYASFASSRRVSDKSDGSDGSDDTPTLVESVSSEYKAVSDLPKSILRHHGEQPRRSRPVRQEETSFLKRASRMSFGSNVFSSTRKRSTTIQFGKTSRSWETYARTEYDRGSDQEAVWTRLTAELAQQIKEELNAYKSHEMKVHDESEQYTHFFYN